MTDPAARLKAQMAELGVKFLERTRAEAGTIVALIAKLGAGPDADNTAAAADLGYLVHRIHGGGATFGFDHLSEYAGAIEQLIDPTVHKGAPLSTETLQQLRDFGQRLREAALAATP